MIKLEHGLNLRRYCPHSQVVFIFIPDVKKNEPFIYRDGEQGYSSNDILSTRAPNASDHQPAGTGPKWTLPPLHAMVAPLSISPSPCLVSTDFARYIMSGLPPCPACSSEYTYEDGALLVCPECAHEWSADSAAETSSDEPVIKDAHGTVLQDGDTVTVIKDLKIKGSSSVVKVGTRVKNIRLVGGDHDIDCKIDGIGAMKLKSEFVKKS